MKLSSHFSLEEMTLSQEASRAGVDNSAPPWAVERLRRTCMGLEAARIVLGCAPIVISSGYRCVDLNRRLGSKDTSQHVTGEAVDFVCPGFGGPTVVAYALRESGVDYDQLILEFGRWVHISFSATGKQRHESLVIDGGGTRPM